MGRHREETVSQVELVRIDLGCGNHKPEGFLGIDSRSVPGVDIVHDLRTGIPLDDNYADIIRARDFLEHLVSPIFIFNECWRVLKAGGLLELEVPRFPHVDSIKDPTHVSFFCVETFTEYFCGPDRLAEEYGMRLWDNNRLTAAERRIWATLTPRGKA